MPASKSKRRGVPKQKAGPCRPNLKKKRAQLDGQFSHFLTMAKSQEADEDLHMIVKALIEEPGKIEACKTAVASDMFLDHWDTELPYDESVGILQRIPLQDLKQWLEEKHRGSVELIQKHWKHDKTLIWKVYWWLTGWENKDPLPAPKPSQVKAKLYTQSDEFRKKPSDLLNEEIGNRKKGLVFCPCARCVR